MTKTCLAEKKIISLKRHFNPRKELQYIHYRQYQVFYNLTVCAKYKNTKLTHLINRMEYKWYRLVNTISASKAACLLLELQKQKQCISRTRRKTQRNCSSVPR